MLRGSGVKYDLRNARRLAGLYAETEPTSVLPFAEETHRHHAPLSAASPKRGKDPQTVHSFRPQSLTKVDQGAGQGLRHPGVLRARLTPIPLLDHSDSSRLDSDRVSRHPAWPRAPCDSRGGWPS